METIDRRFIFHCILNEQSRDSVSAYLRKQIGQYSRGQGIGTGLAVTNNESTIINHRGRVFCCCRRFIVLKILLPTQQQA